MIDLVLLKKCLEIAREQLNAAKEANEGYNIFYALGIWQKETTLHSRLIADLLHPHGYHGLDIKSMELFMECVKPSLPSGFEFKCSDKVEVKAEKATDEARRIDIFLKDEKGQVIIIENKIYAADLPMQLCDYYEFGKKECAKDKEPVVLYLTLVGTEPCKDSIGKLCVGDFYCISYQYCIKDWINRCISIVKNNNALTEVLKQYLQVIEYLTRDGMEKVKQIMNEMKSEEDFDALLLLAKVVSNIPVIAQNVFYKKLRDLLGNWVYKPRDDKQHRIWIELDSSEKWEGLKSWFLIEVSMPRAWCGFTVWKNNTEGDFLCEAGEQLRRFEKVLEEKGIKKGDDGYGVTGKYCWWYMDDVWGTGNFESYHVIKNLFSSAIPESQDYVGRVRDEIEDILNCYHSKKSENEKD